MPKIEFPISPKRIFLIASAWAVAMSAFENTRQPHFLEAASLIEKLWRAEVLVFAGWSSIWVRGR